MLFIRLRLSWIVAAWLFAQCAASLTAAVTLSARPFSVEDTVCQCPGTSPGQMCPMHRSHGKSHDDEGRERCRIGNTLSQTDMIIFAWVGSGVMPVEALTVSVPDAAERVLPFLAGLTARAHLPDAPPPRL